MSRRILLVTTLLLAGCTSGTPTPTPTPPPVKSGFKLVAFDSCEQLTKDLKAAAKKSVGPWGFSGGMMRTFGAVPDGARSAASAGGTADKAAPAFSGTNVHEVGVDEPDIVKTDGKRIVTITGGSLRVIDAASHKATGQLPLDAWGDADLLLSGDRALVLTHQGGGDVLYDRKMPMRPAGAELILVDLTGAPRVISRYRGEGRLVDARQTGDTARVVLTSQPRITFPDRPAARDDDEDRIKANQRVIDRTSVDAWLPSWTVTTGDTTEQGKVACNDVRRPVTYSGRSMLTVLTFPLSAPKLDSGRPVSIVADGDTVYGTPTSLYVASDQRWRLDFFPGRDNRTVPQETDVFRFDVTGSEPPVYRAAGKVPGFLINQYALSEWDGHLRVATTDSAQQSSAVRVLKPDGETLTQVGEVDGLGKNERIYSVRFIGPRAYVVTFRQTDPLYSLDLSNPAAPRVTGELKITGFSAHLQPVGPDRLVGVGQEATEEGRRQGTQVSLFDVSDPAAPRRLAQHHVKNGYSEAEYDPHAILWWPDTKLFAVPVNEGLLALTVTDNGLTEAGQIAPRASAMQVRRNLVIGGELWTLYENGLQISRLSTLEPVTYLRL
ncbi:beta-propeller domain-containing protein [Actinoplanes sp. NPDC089786]|uniref:beta-propeller domain-containing protein n=1 Tax=Actinoplanes sp. NPDC089786 TaxID=3155185 RepID=UPI00343D7C9D